jgi:hypothetical protein
MIKDYIKPLFRLERPLWIFTSGAEVAEVEVVIEQDRVGLDQQDIMSQAQ